MTATQGSKSERLCINFSVIFCPPDLKLTVNSQTQQNIGNKSTFKQEKLKPQSTLITLG